MPAGTRAVHAVSKFGDGDGSFWDRWLGAEPPTVSCFRTGIVTTDRVPDGATAGRLIANRLQVAKQDRESGPEGAASVTTARSIVHAALGNSAGACGLADGFVP